MSVRTWRCKICGDPYVGEGKPTHCPFCGAESRHMIPAGEYEEPEVGKLTEVSRNNIFEAIKLEVSNAQFYFCAAKHAKDIELQARFKALGKVESEHATLLSKIVEADRPKISRDAGECKGDDTELVRESHDREESAVRHYSQFLAQATEPRVREVFDAIVAIEKTHIALAESRDIV